MRVIGIIILCMIHSVVHSQKKGQELIDSIIHNLPAGKDTNRIKALNKIAETYWQLNPIKAFPFTDSALNMAEALHWTKGIARLNNLKGLLVGDTGNNKDSRVYFLKSYELNKQIGNNFGMISNLNNIGRSYQRESDFTQALEYFFKALTIAEEIKNNEQIALVGTNLASSFITQSDYKKGLQYAEMTLKFAELSHTPNNIGKAYYLIGEAKSDMKDTASAKQNLEKALKVYQEMGNAAGVSQTLTALGPLEIPDYKKALGIMLQAQDMLNEMGPGSFFSAGNQANIGKAYLQWAKQSSGKEKEEYLTKSGLYLTRAIDVYKNSGNDEYLADAYHTLSDLEAEKNNWKAALIGFKNFYTINDSIFSQEKKNDLASIENKHNLAIKDKEIAINKLELSSQRRTQAGLIIGLILLGIIGALLIWQNQIRKKSNARLTVLNNQLDEANKIKARVFGILSHDLRSPISTLISFIDLLRNEPETLTISDRKNYQQQIGQSTEDLLQTMETMLIWSKEQMKNFKPDIRTVSVDALFEYQSRFFDRISNSTIEYRNPEQLALTTDENYLQVIMQNLTSNAIKAVGNDPAGRIIWTTERAGVNTIISVSDNGPGMSTEEI